VISGILDKLIFGIVLLTLFQLPLLADHYKQYLSGYYDATKIEVEALNALAQQNNYSDVQALIAAHQASNLPSVRQDADNKQALLYRFDSLQKGIAVFTNESLWQQTAYMLTPSRHETLQRVVSHFEPGIPLSPQYLLICALAALLFNLLMASPVKIVRKVKQRRRTKKSVNSTI
jgi:hypothetical protein